MKFESWKYDYSIVDDGAEVWVWAEFYFRDEEGLLEGKSPVYSKGSSDYHCLLEDAPKIAKRLENGEKWEDVNKDFREAW
ncbi:hypothetical protein [Rivularia sp. UHCC 0363]|uniref:hypothetical protein n=1 Tax=Rivularia sp. UHCC 0363 TaxID=3110244 RepID=UPI002B20AC95|nr:hypothetical protein [Rivularia sp. UHCC 0363]MEA5595679.1 hypothetical protein [Rivularia sp. UHCC 0363]